MIFKGKNYNFGIFLKQLEMLFSPQTKVIEMDQKLKEICGSNMVVDHSTMWKN